MSGQSLNWYFKRVPDGHVFQMPRPGGLIGPVRHYLVDEDRKNAIGKLLQRSAWVCFTAVSAFLVLFLASMMFMQDTTQSMGQTDILKVIGGILLVTALGYALSRVYLQRMLQPIVKDLPPTEQRLALGEKWRNVARDMSIGSIGAGVAAGLVLALAGLVGHVWISRDPANLMVACFNVLAGVSLAAPYVALGFFKATQFRKPTDRAARRTLLRVSGKQTS
jgi:hypothetical protein